MAQQVKSVKSVKSDDPSSIPRAHMEEGLLQVDSHLLAVMCMYQPICIKLVNKCATTTFIC